ncbi:hypothetical protein PAMA_011014 [Pampus argenteus]
MRTVSLLCGCVKYLIIVMVWFVRRVYVLADWFWRKMCFIWRYFRRIYAPIVGRTLLAIGFRRNEHGSQHGEPETSDHDRRQESCLSPEEVGEVYRESGRDAAASSEDTVRREGQFNAEEHRVETAEEFYCDYDSTWETEESQEVAFKNSSRPATSTHYKFNRFRDAARDMQNYRHGYPVQTRPQRRSMQVSDDRPNLNFYLGLRPSSPDGVYISDFHNEWYGEYDTLEYVHTYIQWLFPLQEPGMNWDASTLTKAEIEDFLENTTAKKNLLMSYKLMLDFYGIMLCDEETGDVRRSSNWKERFNNMNSHTHNNLRITRILKCLGTLGYQHYQAPLVRFFLEETLVHGELPKVKDSVLNFFVFAVLDKSERRELIKFAYLNYDCSDEFVWCPKKIQMKWSVFKSPKEMRNTKVAVELRTEYLNVDSEDKMSEAAKAEYV